jgi:hypothetical protein
VKSTGVSSKTSSFDVLCGHGITSRQRNGAMRLVRKLHRQAFDYWASSQ